MPRAPNANAKDVLPPELLEAVQRHYNRGQMYVPIPASLSHQHRHKRAHERRRLALEMKDRGISGPEIAIFLGITRGRVHQILKANTEES